MKKVIAFILDLIGSFLGFGYLIARFTGGQTEGGFNLTGAPALVLFALIIAYFVGMNRFVGTTIGKILLRVKS